MDSGFRIWDLGFIATSFSTGAADGKWPGDCQRKVTLCEGASSYVLCERDQGLGFRV